MIPPKYYPKLLGMRVKCVKLFDGKNIAIGKTGTIQFFQIQRRGYDHPFVLVEFDKHINGHAGRGVDGSDFRGKDGHCWNMEPEYLIKEEKRCKQLIQVQTFKDS